MEENGNMCMVACIEVGSGALRMVVAQTNGKTIEILDNLKKSITLGHDSYTLGSIHPDTITQVCRILNGFKRLLIEYGVIYYRVVATGAVREAANRDHMLDHIKIMTGFDIEVLDNAIERYISVLALNAGLENYRRMRKEGMVLIDVGYGSTQISAVRNGEMTISQNVKLGALRIWEVLSSLANSTNKFPNILEEYIISNLDHIRAMVHWQDIPHCVVMSGENDEIAKLSGGQVTRKRFNQLYLEIKYKDTRTLELEFGIKPEHGEILLPTMMVIKAFMDMTGAQTLQLTQVSLIDGVLHQILQQLLLNKFSDQSEEDIISVARTIAKSNYEDQNHAQDVDVKSVMIFDALMTLHDMGSREKLLLKLASILHDCGKSISSNNHGSQSALIVTASQLIGLNDDEIDMLAFLCKFHSSKAPNMNQSELTSLHVSLRVKAAKLLAILRIADALDKGHKQKCTITDILLEEDHVVIRAKSSSDASLEKWVFDNKAEYFYDVYGLKAVLKVKQVNANG